MQTTISLNRSLSSVNGGMVCLRWKVAGTHLMVKDLQTLELGGAIGLSPFQVDMVDLNVHVAFLKACILLEMLFGYCLMGTRYNDKIIAVYPKQ